MSLGYEGKSNQAYCQPADCVECAKLSANAALEGRAVLECLFGFRGFGWDYLFHCKNCGEAGLKFDVAGTYTAGEEGCGLQCGRMGLQATAKVDKKDCFNFFGYKVNASAVASAGFHATHDSCKTPSLDVAPDKVITKISVNLSRGACVSQGGGR